MQLAHPQALLLLLFLPLAYWPLRASQRTGTRLSALANAFRRAEGWARWSPWLLAHLRALALVLLVLALARPQTPDGQTPATRQGIAIQLVIDTSLSMGYQDYTLDNQAISRMDAARHAVRVFVQGDEKHGLAGRGSDLIGLVSFNQYPDVACPLTTSHDTLLTALDDLALGPYTNIGDGLAWGIERVRKVPTKQKILILLSDGKHNAPDGMDPLVGGKLAAELGVRVYAIGAVGNQPRGDTSFGWARKTPTITRPPADSVDEDTLRKIANMTGGKYYRATDTDGMLAIYRDIDQLEKTNIQQAGTVLWHEWYAWCLVAGLLVLAVEQSLGATRFLLVA